MLATTPNDSSEGSWSDREMAGRKLTGIGIKQISNGDSIALIRARWGSMCILFLPGMTTSGATGTEQAVLLPTKKKLWSLPPVKRLHPSPASPGTVMAPLAPCKQRPQLAGVGDRMDTTSPMMAAAFDLPRQPEMLWGSTTSRGTRLNSNTSSGGCVNIIKGKPKLSFVFQPRTIRKI